MIDKPALYEMKDAPYYGIPRLLRRQGMIGEMWHAAILNTGEALGFLPLPDDASSKAVASNAGKHFDVCSDEDVAAEIRRQLRRPGVREALVGPLWEDTFSKADIRRALKILAQEATND